MKFIDLKPENILLHKSGHVMLVDFDLAKRQVVSAGKASMIKMDSMASPSSTNLPRSAVSLAFDQRENRMVAVRPGGDAVHAPGRAGCCLCGGARRKGVQTAVLDTETQLRVDEVGQEMTKSFVGTYEYIAPEIIEQKGYAGSVDWWTFGVLLYEMLFGVTPFKDKDTNHTLANIYIGEFDLEKNGVSISQNCKDLLGKLLARGVPDRLASPEGIRSHAFFKDVQWPLIRNSEPPYIPVIENELDTRNFRHFKDFVDSDQEFEDYGEGAASESERIYSDKKVNEDDEDDGDESNVIEVSPQKQAVNPWANYDYWNQRGECHWDLAYEAPTKYGDVKCCKDHCKSPVAHKRSSSNSNINS